MSDVPAPSAAPAPAAPPGFGANLAWRVTTAVVVLPALLAAFFLGPPLLGVGIVAAASAIGLGEFFGLLEARGTAPSRLSGFLLAAAVFMEVQPHGTSGPFWPAAVVLLLATTVRLDVDILATIPAAAGTLLGAAYLGALGGTIAALRVLPPEDAGAWRIAMLLGIVMFSDTFAFFVGHALGRRRLAPTISPGKTVEGAVGGIVGGVIGALAVRSWGLPLLPFSHVVVLGGLAAAFGIAGDLFESLLKRWAGVKDSGSLFPGHGGMLDRLDSLLFGAPVLYYYFLWFH